MMPEEKVADALNDHHVLRDRSVRRNLWETIRNLTPARGHER